MIEFKNQYLKIEQESFYIDLNAPIETYHVGIYGVEEDSGREVQIGEMKIQYLNLSETEDSYYDIFDSDNTLFEIYTELFQENSDELKNEIIEKFQNPMFNNFLFFDNIQIYPDFRGQNAGLKAMHLIIDKIGRECSYVILKAVPLQFEIEKYGEKWETMMAIENFEQEQPKAQKKLIAHYAKLGLKQIKSTSHMLLNRDLTQSGIGDL